MESSEKRLASRFKIENKLKTGIDNKVPCKIVFVKHYIREKQVVGIGWV